MDGRSPVGAVFTPPFWARWALDRLDAPSRIAAGASFCDPTAGEGAFAHALAEAWAGTAGTFDRTWADRITLVDREGTFLEAFARTWRQRWGFPFPEARLVETDVVTSPPPGTFDLVAGNPPWVTYPDLSPPDRERYRPWFPALGLVGRPRDLLLGRSRLDLAALVTARVFTSMVAPGGRAGFFLPLSLFHNEGAPGRWRRWRPDAVFDLTDLTPFPGVATRCGWAEFTPASPPEPGTPLPYFTGTPGAWTPLVGRADAPGAPWRVLAPGAPDDLPRWDLPPARRPRQGLNTGGLNAAFHVSGPPPGVDPACVHPLVPQAGSRRPARWILVPYDRRGTIFDQAALEHSGLARWWEPWRDRLAARRGVLLGSQLSRGRWWALLGAGPYAFAPYKVVWSAYGKDRLDARVWGPRSDGTVWQADQALQAYIPCDTGDEAEGVAAFLNGPEVAAYLASLRGAGTRSWAQPGRFKPLWRTPPGTGTAEGTTGS
jgi:hypothetical protein